MKKHIITTLCALGALCLTACSDWLDVKSDTVEREKDLYTSYQGYKEALAGCYTAMVNRSVYGEKLTMTDIENLACLWQPLQGDTYGDHRGALQEALMKHEYGNQYAEDAIKSIYGGLYNVISQVNILLSHEDEAQRTITTSQSRNVLLGEAYALRAYCHMDVLRLFGQMPQNATKQVQLPYAEKAGINEVAPYYGFDAFVEKLQKDLDKAESLLKESDPIVGHTYYQLNMEGNDPITLDDEFLQYRRFRMNYYAVKALKARLYLYLGKKEQAYAEAKAVIGATTEDGSKVIDLSGISDTDDGYNALPNECLLALSAPNLIDYSINLLGDPTAQIDNYSHMHVSTTMLNQELFANQSTVSNNRYLKVWNKDAMNNQGITYPAICKYYYNAQNYTKASDYFTLLTRLQVIPLIRLSEMYLIVLETTNDLAEANNLYVDYMASHNVNITTSFASLDEVRSEVIDEYRREFYAEGLMFYVYKRLGTAAMKWNSDEMTENQYIIPLPNTEYNPNIN